MSLIKYFFQRLVARVTDDKDMLRELSEERKAEKRERNQELKEKQKERKETLKAKKKNNGEAEAAVVKPEDLEGSRCFGDPIQLNTKNFFSTDVFNKYYNRIIADSQKSENLDYIFVSLDEAKAKCQKSSALFPTKCTGILSYNKTEEYHANVITGKKGYVSKKERYTHPLEDPHTARRGILSKRKTRQVTRYLVYDEDPKLLSTVKPNTNAAKFAAMNPVFIPAPDCAAAAAGPPKPTMCFTTTIQLSPTNFFKSEAFDKWFKMISAVAGGPRDVFEFDTLELAKAKCQMIADCKGIIIGKDGSGSGKPVYLVYTGDTTLVNTVTNGSIAKRIASQNPQFIPAVSCKSLADAEERKTFSVKRMFKRAFGVTMNILHIFLFIALGVFGASLATNLNVYRGWPYRLLYAIYGFVFFFVVIPYVLLWRWLYQKKRPRFYALIPLIGSPIENNILATLLSWFTFEPDDEMAFLDGCRA
jgi:hypothetical protein